MAAGRSLDELPPELLSQIISHLDFARALLNLSLTCRRICDYIERDGYRVFVQTQFPSIQTPPYWKDAAHALTTLSRAWERKALIARCLIPNDRGRKLSYHGIKSGLRPIRRAQTMGYQPVIDSYIDWHSEGWSSRKEVLTWGAGADLVVRTKSMGIEAERAYQESRVLDTNHELFDQHQHMTQWMVYRKASVAEGRDDIISVNMLRPSQKTTTNSDYIVVGRASGHLGIVKASRTNSQSSEVTGLKMGRPVRSASVNSSPDPLIAVCVADSTISFFSFHLAQSLLEPVGNISAILAGQSGRTWSAKFLRHDRLAVGLGPHKQSLHVYELGHGSVSTGSPRKFAICAPATDNRLDKLDCVANVTSTIYSIAPLTSSSSAGGAEGDLFLTGAYDGTTRYVADITTIHPSIDDSLSIFGRLVQESKLTGFHLDFMIFARHPRL